MNAPASRPHRKPAIVRSIRTSRTWHSRLGLVLAALVLVSAVTGLLLAYKKQSEWLQPGTRRGAAGSLADWRPLAELEATALVAFRQNAGPDAEASVDRMDVRPGKGVVKVRFDHEDYEVQVDGITGEVLNVGRRHADWIERLHDGSLISENFKLASMSSLGLGLLLMTGTGMWLYWGPRRYRAQKRASVTAHPR